MAKSTKKSSEDPCWEGYHKVGMKMKNGKLVPDCVPIKKAGKKAATKKAATKKAAGKKTTTKKAAGKKSTGKKAAAKK